MKNALTVEMSPDSKALRFFGDDTNLDIVTNTPSTSTINVSLGVEVPLLLTNESKCNNFNEIITNPLAQTMNIPLDARAVHLNDQIKDSSLDNVTSTPLEPALNMILHNERLHFLTHELPDSNLELYCQHHFLTEFHLFPELPIELRFRIWNLVCPQHITTCFDDNLYLRSRTATPVTFRIDRESGVESMRHYDKPYRLEAYQPNKSQRALHQHWFDPEVDSVCIQHHFLGRFKTVHFSRLWVLTPGEPFVHIENRASIQSLEIHGLSCRNMLWLDWEEFYLTGSDRDGVKFKRSIFLAFTGLKELTLRGGSGALQGCRNIKDCISTSTRCYEKLRAGGADKEELCGVPRIRIRLPCHKMKMGGDLECCEKCCDASTAARRISRQTRHILRAAPDGMLL